MLPDASGIRVQLVLFRTSRAGSRRVRSAMGVRAWMGATGGAVLALMLIAMVTDGFFGRVELVQRLTPRPLNILGRSVERSPALASPGLGVEGPANFRASKLIESSQGGPAQVPRPGAAGEAAGQPVWATGGSALTKRLTRDEMPAAGRAPASDRAALTSNRPASPDPSQSDDGHEPAAVQALASQLALEPSDVKVTRDGDLLTVTARVRAINGQALPVKDLVVVGADGGPVYIGDVAPQGEAVSGPFAFGLDVSSWPSRSLHVPVTLQFSVDGQAVEVPWTINYFRTD